MKAFRLSKNWLFVVLSVISIVLVQLACLSFGAQDTADGPGEDNDVQLPADSDMDEPSEDTTEDDAREGAMGDDGSGEDGDEQPIEPNLGSDDTLPCPPKGTVLSLGFDHALTVNYGDVSVSHFLHSGWIGLIVTDDNGTIGSENIGLSLDYSMEGRMGDDCALVAEGTMQPSVTGSCEAGVVLLMIDENWAALDGEMECVDDDGDKYIMPFNVPPMGLQQHRGVDGNGEIFYLVEGAEGYTTMRPFVEGDGYHSWTLAVLDPFDIP